ncbi:MAG: TolC family protein [Vicinamibacterales bacterium]
MIRRFFPAAPAAAALLFLLAVAPGHAQTPLVNNTLTLDDAIQRGLQFNLGVLDVREGVRQAQGQRRASRAALLPSVLADLTETTQQLNLAAMGFRFQSPFPDFEFPSVVGPFNQFDLRARLSQNVFDLTALNSYRAAGASLKARELSAEDAQDVVVAAVGGAYIQAQAARARVETGRAQVETAQALLDQAQQRRIVGLAAQVDVDRSRVQLLHQQQQLIALQNDFAKLKIDLAQMIGTTPTDQYQLGDPLPFSPGPAVDLDTALRQAREQRADLRAARSLVMAAAKDVTAARAAYLPTVRVDADYGTIGPNPSDARRTFAVVGRVRVPIWQAGRIEGQIQQAEAQLARRQAELDDLERRVVGDVRKAVLDLAALAAQVEVAEQNLGVTRETLELTRQRFEAGVSDSVEVVQAQESVSTAAFDHENSVFAHNLAKQSLARALGQTAERLREFLTP